MTVNEDLNPEVAAALVDWLTWDAEEDIGDEAEIAHDRVGLGFANVEETCSASTTSMVSLETFWQINRSESTAESSCKHYVDPQVPSAGSTDLPQSNQSSQHTSNNSNEQHPCKELAWIPYALRWQWIAVVITFGTVLLVIVGALHAKSSRDYGIADDHGKKAVVFAWRFLPTLLAVTYVTMLMSILDAVKRTEPFYRLSKECGASAHATLLRCPGSWWSTLIDSFPRKANDHCFSPTMFCAVCAYIIGFMVISTFSAGFLAPETVVIKSQTRFSRIKLDSSMELQPELGTLEFFHTVSNVLQNVTTSPWISDKFTILPFWPSHKSRPSGSRFPGSEQVWRAESLVFQSKLSCETFQSLTGVSNINVTDESGWSIDTVSIHISSESGCKFDSTYTLRYLHTLLGEGKPGLMLWAKVSDTKYYPIDPLVSLENISNVAKECNSMEAIIMTPHAPSAQANIVGQLCRPQFYLATLPIEISITPEATTATLDENSFYDSRTLVNSSFVNLAPFQSQFLYDSSWAGHLGYSTWPERPATVGPAVLLASSYNFNVTSAMYDSGLVDKASRILSRAFGEAIQVSLQKTTNTTISTGTIMRKRRRIAVTSVAAIILESCLAVTVCLSGLVFWFSRLNRRPLGISEDPAFSNTVVSLVGDHAETKVNLHSMSFRKPKKSESSVLMPSFAIKEGSIISCSMHSDWMQGQLPQVEVTAQLLLSPSSSRKPDALALCPTLALLFSLLSFTLLLVVLFWYSQKHGLSSQIVLSEITIGGTKDPLGKLALYSVIPTLLAVLISLWWGAIETQFRTAQPYVSQAREATTSANGSGLSYQSSYLAWAALRAAYRRHLLLALVCFGATLSQIFTISTSALFKREVSSSFKQIRQMRTLQLRQAPFFSIQYLPDPPYEREMPLADIVYQSITDLRSNWLYSASLQLTLNASEPHWSKDGWSFVPVPLPAQDTKNQYRSDASHNLSTNASFYAMMKTPAIRGRLVCSPIATGLEERLWLRKEDLTNSANWDTAQNRKDWTHGYSLGCGGFEKEPVINFHPNRSDSDPCNAISAYTTVLSSEYRPSCCGGSSTLLPGSGSLGYWSPIYYNNAVNSHDRGKVKVGRNITVKWIHGPAPGVFVSNKKQQPHLIWPLPRPPKLAMLTCEPIIEAAMANATVQQSSGQVQKYIIDGDPLPYEPAWMEEFAWHHPKNEADPSKRETTYTFGHFFLAALLGASQLSEVAGYNFSDGSAYFVESPYDHQYNMKTNGLNLDLMSYSMLSLAGNNPEALLSHQTLADTAQKTFTVFFQHFASSNISINGSGNRVFQMPDEKLPVHLVPLEDPSTEGAPTKASPMADPTATVTLIKPIDTLRMSPLATWLCVTILAWLIMTTIVLLIRRNKYFSPLIRDVNTLADVANMVVSSERYLELAQRKGASGLRADKTFRTRLGWFRTRTGEVNWGIELADGDVEFLSSDEVERLYQEQE